MKRFYNSETDEVETAYEETEEKELTKKDFKEMTEEEFETYIITHYPD